MPSIGALLYRLALALFWGPVGPFFVLPYGMWCFPQLVPNYVVSRRFYCNFLCLIYLKVAKCFHKERTGKSLRKKTIVNLLFLYACFGKHLMIFAYLWSGVKAGSHTLPSAQQSLYVRFQRQSQLGWTALEASNPPRLKCSKFIKVKLTFRVESFYFSNF